MGKLFRVLGGKNMLIVFFWKGGLGVWWLILMMCNLVLVVDLIVKVNSFVGLGVLLSLMEVNVVVWFLMGCEMFFLIE